MTLSTYFPYFATALAVLLGALYVFSPERIPIIRRQRLGALLLVLSVELLAAGWWRWPWTVAPIQTPFDYGTGHVAVVSENWRRHGALRQHFLPVLSTDLDLPEWPYRTQFSQEYFSVPPLAFMLHYGATRLVRVEPVLLGKYVAQFLIVTSTLVAAILLYPVFEWWPTLIGLSFLIWGMPFLLWFSNGYFAVNVGLAVQLVFAAWCSHVGAASLKDDDRNDLAAAFSFVLGGVLAFLGGFADYLPLAANAIGFAWLVGIATILCPAYSKGRRVAIASAVGVLIGSSAAVLSTLILYSRQMGLRRYWQALTTRVADRSGEGPVVEHFDVIRRQMLTAWPPELLLALTVMLLVVVGCCAIVLVKGRTRPQWRNAVAMLLGLATAIVPSFLFHYRALNYVRIHWWFAGTWTIGWVVTICAFMWWIGQLAQSIRNAGAVRAQGAYRLACSTAFVLVVALNLNFVKSQAADDARVGSVRLYRSLGRSLPHDEWPLVVTDLTNETPGLFEDYPYATSYLRRPLLLREPSGQIRLPAVDEPSEGKLVRIGGEDARDRLLRRGGQVYVAYDPDARQCHGVDIPISGQPASFPIKVCRASAEMLVRQPDAVLGPMNSKYQCSGPPHPPSDLHIVSNGQRVVVLAWSDAGERRTSYVLEAGRGPGRSDVLATDIGRTDTFTATDVKPATYYARVRGKNACGTGAASNEIVVVVR